jgi:SAM-dependent methyltransferase
MAIDTSLFTPIERCPLCDSTRFDPVRRELVNTMGFTEDETRFFARYVASDPFEFRRCRDCSFIYLDRLPTSDEYFHLLYSRVEYDFAWEFEYNGKKNIFRDVKRHLQKYRPSGTLLDVGTWCGTLLESLRDTYTVVGCELDEKAAAHGRTMGLDIRSGFFQSLLYDRPFDIITMIDVLEHMQNPRGIIEQVFQMLGPGGLFYIKSPNGAAQVRKENVLSSLKIATAGASFGFIHINHFSRRALVLALEAAGFEVLETGYAPLENWDMRIPVGFPERARRRLLNLSVNAIVAALAALYSVTRLDLGPHLYAIARKPG